MTLKIAPQLSVTQFALLISTWGKDWARYHLFKYRGTTRQYILIHMFPLSSSVVVCTGWQDVQYTHLGIENITYCAYKQ